MYCNKCCFKNDRFTKFQMLRTSLLIFGHRLLLIATTTFVFSFNQLINPVFAASQPEDSWAQLQQRGTNALDANEYWIAEPTLLKAIAQAERFGPTDIRLAKSMGELGRLYTIRGRFNEAETCLEDELYIKEHNLDGDRYQCIPVMASLIKFYLTYGTKNKAIPLTEEMLSLVDGKLDRVRAGKYKIKLQKGQPLQGWLGVGAAVTKEPIIEWAIACDAVGNCYKTDGNFDLAERLFKTALTIKTIVLGNSHLSLANSYDSLGSLCQEKNDLHEAESYFADALDITERTLEPHSHEVFIRLDKLARCLIKEGKYQQAEVLYLRAQNFWQVEPSKYGDEARAAYSLGSLYTQEHKYASALPYLRQALELAEKFNGPDSYAVIPYLRRYSYTLYYLGHKSETQQLQDRANTISNTN